MKLELSPERLEELGRRMAAGLLARRAALEASDADYDQNLEELRREPSVFAALEAQRRPDTPKAQVPSHDVYDRWIFVVASLGAPSIAAQRDLLKSISPPSEVDFNALYSLGGVFWSTSLSWTEFEELPDVDFSILMETLSNAERLPAELEEILRPKIDSFINSVSRRRKIKFRGFGELSYRTAAFEGPVGLKNLADVNKYVIALRSRFLHILGPDLPAAIQLLCDPFEDPSPIRLGQMLLLFRRWGMQQTFVALLLLRTTSGYEGSEGFVRSNVEQMLSPNDLVSLGRARAMIGVDGVESGELPKGRGGYFDTVTALVYELNASLRRGDAWTVFNTIAELFHQDQNLMSFLPWKLIYELYIQWPEITAATTFAAMLMSDEAVSRRYPNVTFAAGKGAFIADLTSLIEPKHRSGATSALLSKFNKLPRRAAEALTVAILQRPIMERLANSLPQARRWNDRSQQADIDPISALRIDSLRTAGQKKLIPVEFMELQIAREVEHVTLLYLQGRMRIGRVRMPWPEIAKDLHDQFEEGLPINSVRQAMELDEPPVHLVRRFSEFVGVQVASHLIYESEFGIDQALSNNLRHGVVLPRYLRVFDDAFQAVLPARNLQSWEESHLSRWFGSDAGLILEIRDEVAEAIREFISYHLTVEKGRGFERGLARAICDLIESSLNARGKDVQRDLEKRIVSAVKRDLGGALLAASKALHEDIRPRFIARIRGIRRQALGGLAHRTSSFLESIEANLEDAHEEVRSWLHIADSKGAAIPFHIQQLVKLHLFSTSLYASDKLRVSCKITIDGRPAAKGDAAISGKYVDFFEVIVSNLLSNAFAKSGDRLKTKVDLGLSINGDQMTIRCSNAINERRVEQVIMDHGKTVALSKRPLGGNANKDKLSGFQKVRAAYKTAFKCQPIFNIPPVSVKARRFVIELTSAAPRDLLA